MREMVIWKQRYQDNPLVSGQHSSMEKGAFSETGNSRGGTDGGSLVVSSSAWVTLSISGSELCKRKCQFRAAALRKSVGWK